MKRRGWVERLLGMASDADDQPAASAPGDKTVAGAAPVESAAAGPQDHPSLAADRAAPDGSPTPAAADDPPAIEMDLDLDLEEAELAGLLDLMREPAKHVIRVDETCVIDPQHAGQRTLELKLLTPPGRQTRLLDVKHPLKGTLDMVSVSGSCPVGGISHHAHVQVSQNLITYRYLTLLQTADGPLNAALIGRAAEDLFALRRIPSEGPTAALRIFNEHFERREGKWHLRTFDTMGVTGFDENMLDSLGRLCKRLCRRYLQLVRVHGSGQPTEDIKLLYTEQMSAEPIGTVPRWHLPKRFRRASKEWLNSPSPTWRFHIPWAKRTSHYSFTLTSPEDRFLSLQGLAVAEAEGSVRAVLDSPPPDAAPDKRTRGIVFNTDEPKWSIQTRQGRGSSIFVGDAHRYQLRLFCVFRALELPGRSLLRMTFVTTFVLAVLGSLAAWKFMEVGALPQASTLIPTVLAIGALALQPQGSPGVLGYPARSRVTPAVLAAACVLFTFWLTSNGTVTSPAMLERAKVDGLAEGAWNAWRDYGWIPVLGLLGLYWAHTVHIYRATVHAYRDRLSEKTLVSDNFYHREEAPDHG